MAITSRLVDGKHIQEGLAADRTPLTGQQLPPALTIFIETDTASPNMYISSGNAATGWLGPFTAAQVGLGGGGGSSSGVSGLLNSRWIEIAHAETVAAAEAAGRGVATWVSPGVLGLEITAARIKPGTAQLARGTNLVDPLLRVSVNMTSAAEDDINLPAIAPAAATSIGNVMTFNLPIILDGSNICGIGHFQPFAIPVKAASSGDNVKRLAFVHALGVPIQVQIKAVNIT